MASMLRQIDEKYGSIEGFITQELDYTKEEVEKMRANLKALWGMNGFGFQLVLVIHLEK